MEADLYRPGNLLCADNRAIKTTNRTTTVLIAGSAHSSGYKNGIGGDAKFNCIAGFVQLSPDQIFLADCENHCLRFVDRTMNRTSDYAGNSLSMGDTDGTTGLLRLPFSVLIDVKNPNSYRSTQARNLIPCNLYTPLRLLILNNIYRGIPTDKICPG